MVIPRGHLEYKLLWLHFFMLLLITCVSKCMYVYIYIHIYIYIYIIQISCTKQIGHVVVCFPWIINLFGGEAQFYLSECI